MKLPDFQFRDFPDYAVMTETLQALQAAAPALMKLEVLGKSREGRDLYMVTLGDTTTGNPDERPAIYMDGDLHPLELGRIHLMYIMRILLQEHEEDGILNRRTFYIIPSINPDNVERVIKQGVPFIRSSFPVEHDQPDMLYPSDVNGDGKILWMRQECADGNQMEDPLDPRLMIPRTPGAKGPFYKMIPEGMIENWGGTKEYDVFRAIDWDASFPVCWEPHRTGGEFMPMSEPELCLAMDFIYRHANICGVFSFHVGGASLVLPPNRLKLEPMDEAYYAGVGRDYTKFTKLEARRSIDHHVPPWYWWVPSGDRPGTLVDYIHYTFGIPGFDFEVDSLYEDINYHLKDIDDLQGWDEYNEMNRKMLAYYDSVKDETSPDVFVPWKKFMHPQLGEVEIGGLLSHVTYIRPLPEVPAECERITKFFVHFANQAPQAAIADVTVAPLPENGLFKISARAFNAGARPTYLVQRALQIWGKPVPRMEFFPADGVTVLDGVRRKKAGHLEAFASSQPLEWIVKAPAGTTRFGTLELKAGSIARAAVDLR